MKILTPEQSMQIAANEKKCNHFLHLVLTIFTAGLWLIPWFLVANQVSAHNKKLRCQITGETDWLSRAFLFVFGGLAVVLALFFLLAMLGKFMAGH